MPAIPITPEKATLFAAYLGAEGLAAATVESYLAALHHYRLLLEPASPCPSFRTPYMKLLLRSIKRVRACEGPQTIRLPITTTLMHRIKESLHVAPKDYGNLLTWAAYCTGFFGFLRCGEFLLPDGAQFDPSTHLFLADLAFAGSSYQGVIRLRIKAFKTDQGRVGTTIVLASTGKDICPVLALLDYLESRGVHRARSSLTRTSNLCAATRSWKDCSRPSRWLEWKAHSLTGTASALGQPPLQVQQELPKPPSSSWEDGRARLSTLYSPQPRGPGTHFSAVGLI